MVKKILLFIGCCFCTLLVFSQQKTCYTYEPDTVTLTGIITRKTFPGPPNYESIKAGDKPETYWILTLSKPICLNGKKNDFYNTDKQNVSQLQLVFLDDDGYKKYKRFLNNTATVKGTLFGAQTGHHHTEVLITVTAISGKE